MHLVSVNGSTVLLDCGMYQGRRAEAWERNRNFPFDPALIGAVVLSHAHIDHSGNLPGLVRQGFRGRIFATHATRSLCAVMLRDSAFIQQRDVEFINKKHRKKGLAPVEPLYDESDVDATIPLFSGQDYARPFDVADGVSCRFEDAGHILGSASVSVTLREGKTVRRIAYTGDLGRPHLPILRDPVFVGDAEYLISESTYGGRVHAPVEDMERQLLEPIRRAADRGGKIVIPAFSVGRTQELVYVLHRMRREGLVGSLPVFVDSPLSVNVTEVFRNHPECYDEETRAMLRSPEGNDPFGFETLTYIRSVEDSRELNDRPGPFIVIAASGMCEAGRILHHLVNSIGDSRNMVLIVGYQAEHTLGKKLVMREPVVNIFGEPHELRAEVAVLNSFSGHADRNELVDYLARFERSALQSTFLVHGDLDQSEKLGTVLRERGFRGVSVPVRGQRIPLD
jgi:metallo-beta-lactamase family protein